MPLSKPHLPTEFLKQLLAQPMMQSAGLSYIFTPEFHKQRLEIVADILNPEDPLIFPQNSEAWTWLHMAINMADPPLFCEMLRLGALVDKVDHMDRTPLMFLMEYLSSQNSVFQGLGCDFQFQVIDRANAYRGAMQANRWALRTTPQTKELVIQRVIYIANLLIEQHADVNVSREIAGFKFTPLHIACMLHRWDLIELLLKHGAHPRGTTSQSRSAVPSSFLEESSEKHRFECMVAQYAGTPRPSRMCPCFSNKCLLECHTITKPYPRDFLCKCGSKKTYSGCCEARGILVTETWSEVKQWLEPVHTIRVLQSIPAPFKRDIMDVMDTLNIDTLPVPMDMIPELKNPEIIRRYCRDVCDKDDVDPCFKYAVQKTGEIPKSIGRVMAKGTCEMIRSKWNAAIDEYVSLGTDRRSAHEIIQATKVGPTLGVYFRTCYASRCSVKETESFKMKTCSVCNAAFFCSKECQKSAWNAHKKECGPSMSAEPDSPARTTFDEFLFARIQMEA